ncbi:Hypothetical predicted protein [Olea europaea subsp. europaea]|uniref:Uncharacterized protein n=1 Tax=Olea europaea subsp. europaea TaxID=158383 RepID=A0A8S0QI10_OLEEU|nr:Hypothetical predicted protein [Olea europaea subsp. europaea]
MSSSIPFLFELTRQKEKKRGRDTVREEAWTNRKRNYQLRCGKFSVTDDDLEELRGCFQLGFNFDSPDLDPKLSSAFPVLGFYHAVNRQFSNSLSRSSSSLFSDCDSVSSVGSASAIIDPVDDDPVILKTRLSSRHKL